MPKTKQDPIEAIRECVEAQAELKERYREAVTYARAEGLSWEAIGEAMGMSKQAAHSYGRRQAITDPR